MPRRKHYHHGVSPTDAGRCERCILHLPQCICAEIPSVPTRTRIVVIRHVAELWKPSNTARWAALALPNLEIVSYGAEGAPLEPSRFCQDGSVLLYPDGAPATLAEPPRTLVVLDGTWHQSRHMLQRTPALRALPRLALPSPPARHRLRQPREPGHMSTLEAIAAALTAIESPAAGAALERFHDDLVERLLARRTAPPRQR